VSAKRLKVGGLTQAAHPQAAGCKCVNPKLVFIQSFKDAASCRASLAGLGQQDALWSALAGSGGSKIPLLSREMLDLHNFFMAFR
jgi:hypothetical protein